MQASFARSMSSLDDVFGFAENFLAGRNVDGRHLFAIKLVIEELFTNMVKFNPDGPDTIALEMADLDDAVQVRLTDREPAPFDVTEPRGMDTEAPIERRDGNGMGLFLVQRFVDAMEYAYRDGVSTITFVKRLG